MKKFIVLGAILFSIVNTTKSEIKIKTKCKITNENNISKSVQLMKLVHEDHFTQRCGEFTIDIFIKEPHEETYDFDIIIKKNDKIIKKDSFTSFLGTILYQKYALEFFNYRILFVLKSVEHQEDA